MVDVERCIVCEGGDFQLLYDSSYHGSVEEATRFFLTDRKRAVHGDIRRCRQCAFEFTSPQFTPHDYERIYSSIPPAPDGSTAREQQRRFTNLARRVRRDVQQGRFLDFGCGDGSFCRFLPEFHGVGFELRADEARWGDGVYYGTLDRARHTETAFADRSFDFAVAWDVLEHLPEIERDMASLLALLKPGGFLFVTVPNVASLLARMQGSRWNCRLLEHLWYFSPETLSRFLTRLGFRQRYIAAWAYPTSLGILGARIEQTYDVRLPIPKSIARLTIALPIGLMLGVFQRG
jgi:2-polyprenyl-3-methyl-5-hydroxy-6-metoxy-1,4-benzoquinol methylase